MKTANLRTVTLSEILNLPVHPVADLFPMLADQVRKENGTQEALVLPELANSILEDGLQVPIVLFNDEILDGRNRRSACFLVAEALGVLPESYQVQVQDFIGTPQEADNYVLDLNVHRRDLSPGQRAFVAVGYWELRSPGQGARTDLGPSSNLEKVDTAEDLSQLFGVSRGYIVNARRIFREIEDGRKQADRAAQEAESQRAIAKQKNLELEAANAAHDAAKALEASRDANRAANAAIEAAEKATEKATQTARVASRVDKVRAGTAPMNSLAKAPKPEVNDTDPTVKFRNKINTAMGTFKQAITELATLSSQGEDDFNYIGRKITDLIEHFEHEFGVLVEA